MAKRVLQLKIELDGIVPKIWRRFLVRDDISFRGLHEIIQIIMGWENYHLYEFCIGQNSIASEEAGFNPAEGVFKQLSGSPEFIKMLEQTNLKNDSASLDSNKVNKILKDLKKNKPKPTFDMNAKICELIKSEGEKFTYVYDFGDKWNHTLKVEKVLNVNDVDKCPACLDGERGGPPEDCGGVHGYYELQRIKKNKKHPLFKERIVEWLGEDFDFEVFSIDSITKELGKK
jgi:hypothetical protein